MEDEHNTVKTNDANAEIRDFKQGIPPFETHERTHKTRQWATYVLLAIVGLLSLTIIGGTILRCITIEDAKDLGQSYVTPLVTILAIAFAFYFKEK